MPRLRLPKEGCQSPDELPTNRCSGGLPSTQRLVRRVLRHEFRHMEKVLDGLGTAGNKIRVEETAGNLSCMELLVYEGELGPDRDLVLGPAKASAYSPTTRCTLNSRTPASSISTPPTRSLMPSPLGGKAKKKKKKGGSTRSSNSTSTKSSKSTPTPRSLMSTPPSSQMSLMSATQKMSLAEETNNNNNMDSSSSSTASTTSSNNTTTNNNNKPKSKRATAKSPKSPKSPKKGKKAAAPVDVEATQEDGGAEEKEKEKEKSLKSETSIPVVPDDPEKEYVPPLPPVETIPQKPPGSSHEVRHSIERKKHKRGVRVNIDVSRRWFANPDDKAFKGLHMVIDCPNYEPTRIQVNGVWKKVVDE
ncbi:unnamed protein product, partial [Mesorhabditis spiculigera]